MLGELEFRKDTIGKEASLAPHFAAPQPLPPAPHLAAPQPLPYEPDLFPEYDAAFGTGASRGNDEGDRLAFANGYLARVRPQHRRAASWTVAALIVVAAIGAIALVIFLSGSTIARPPAKAVEASPIEPMPGSAPILDAGPSVKLYTDRVLPEDERPDAQDSAAPPLTTLTQSAEPEPATLVLASASTDPTELSAPVDTAESGVLVQVSSLRSEDVALAEFRALQQRHPAILGDRQPDIQRADLGPRGVYYRVRVSYPTRQQAATMCAGLKRAGADCLVVSQ